MAFEADDPNVAETVSLRLASHIAEEVHVESYESGDDNLGLYMQDLRGRLAAAQAEMTTWSARHKGKTPPPELTRKYQGLYFEYTDALNENELSLSQHRHRFPPLGLNVEIVRTPRVSDGRVGSSLLLFAGAGAAAGLLIGLFTMPPFFWWRR